MKTIEDKLKLETEITALQRELKKYSSLVADVKGEYGEILTVLENNKKLISEQEVYYKNILNDIAQAKLQWVTERHNQMAEIDSKKKDIEGILAKEVELQTLENKIKLDTEKNTTILNETRRLELEIADKNLLIDARQRELVDLEKKILKEREVTVKIITDFKERAEKVFIEIKKL